MRLKGNMRGSLVVWGVWHYALHAAVKWGKAGASGAGVERLLKMRVASFSLCFWSHRTTARHTAHSPPRFSGPESKAGVVLRHVFIYLSHLATGRFRDALPLARWLSHLAAALRRVGLPA